jgi:hypothetical protein
MGAPGAAPRGFTAPPQALCGGRVPDPGFSGVAGEVQRSEAPTIGAAGFDTRKSDLKFVGRDLAGELAELFDRELSVAPGASGDSTLRRAGDVLRELRGSSSRSETWDALKASQPAAHAALYPVLSELVEDAWARNVGIDQPWGDDVGIKDDGLYTFPGTSQARAISSKMKPYWPRIGRVTQNPPVAQAAALIWPSEPRGAVPPVVSACAAATAVKRAERALDEYPAWVGLHNPYRRVGLIGNKEVQGPNRSFAVWDLSYTATGKVLAVSGEKTFDLKILERFDSSHRLVTEYYSEDERWGIFTGTDTYLPVYASDGEFVALVVVTRFTCDGADNVWRIVRENLGNLKLRASAP